jgi:hypothetical protein
MFIRDVPKEASMAYNRTLVAAGSIGIGLAGDAAPKVFSHLSLACQDAVGNMASDDVIAQACGSGFSDVSLLGVFFIGLGAFIVINFWKEIVQAVTDKDRSRPAY